MSVNWVTFTRRTEDPKLAWLENQLTHAGVYHRRRGHSFHAPILQVPDEQLDLAWGILSPELDVLEDDDTMFEGHAPTDWFGEEVSSS